jgi:hypothetical protein
MDNIKQYIIDKYLPTTLKIESIPYIYNITERAEIGINIKKKKIRKMINKYRDKYSMCINITYRYPVAITSVMNYLLEEIMVNIMEPIIKKKHLLYTINKDKELLRYYHYNSYYKWNKKYPSFYTKDEILYFINKLTKIKSRDNTSIIKRKKITDVALNFINYIINYTFKNLIKTSIIFMEHRNVKTLSTKELQSAIRNNLSGELSKHANSEMIKAIHKVNTI